MKTKIVFAGIVIEMILLLGFTGSVLVNNRREKEAAQRNLREVMTQDYIKWVDFDISYEALCKAYEIDLTSHENADETSTRIDWVDVLSYTAAKTGGEFGKKSLSIMDELVIALEGGETLSELTTSLSYYSYYREAYGAVLDGMVGEYEVQSETGKWEKKYGLKAYSPIAKGFDYSDYDDFGVSRSYGFQRQHLGHDMMGLVGTPIIAVESGTVEALGWNQYGGWRIGIRSADKKRYYYYAHLRQNRPYAEGLEEGASVTAGDVIGYMGHTGYSATENVNNINEVHLHFGIELIFDESQKDGNNEIWINPYALTRFLTKNRSEVLRNEETKEWTRKYSMR